ncbi:hypothetical protein MtrunA17_Chr6g0467851 [Medicago truncatula]|uniref:Uncharacterized protein n=1 Tax=Medicago truncatula TaxID=3880 RepID=A0A396HDH0_MEDTR|nr:hypothetical protein MtrunA17_Chr6g0467851 [Medicago truncatula]
MLSRVVGPTPSGVKEPEPNLESCPKPSGVAHPEPNREVCETPSGVKDPEPSLEPCPVPSGVKDPDPIRDIHFRVEKCSKPKIFGASPLRNSSDDRLSGKGVEVPEVEITDPGDTS